MVGRPDKIQLDIVTPRGRVLTASVDEATAPSIEGEFGVLPGHLPLLAALRTGIVTYRVGSETTKCAVGPGFAEVGPSAVSVLTDEYIVRESIDPVVVRKELGEVQQKIAARETRANEPGDTGAGELLLLVNRENWLAAQLELYGDPPPATMRAFET